MGIGTWNRGEGRSDRVFGLATLALAIVLSAGCTPTFRINPEAKMEGLSAASRSPLHAGVYYSPQFATHEQARVSGSQTWVANIGVASVKMFDELVPKVFAKTTRVSQPSGDELKAKGIDVVIAPSLVHFDFKLGGDVDSDRYSVVYRTTLYTVQGVPIASWLSPGNAKSASGPWIWNSIEDNMKDAAQHFLQAFQREAGPALAAIAASREKPGTKVNPRDVSFNAGRGEFSGVDPAVAKALREAGVLTVRLAAQNATERGFVVRASDTRLRLKNGQVVEPATVSSVLSALDQTSQAGGIAAAFVGPLIGVLVDASASQEKQEQREVQFKALSGSLFLDRAITKGKEESGNILFRMPKGMATADATALTVWIVDPSQAEGVQVEIPLQITQ